MYFNVAVGKFHVTRWRMLWWLIINCGCTGRLPYMGCDNFIGTTLHHVGKHEDTTWGHRVPTWVHNIHAQHEDTTWEHSMRAQHACTTWGHITKVTKLGTASLNATSGGWSYGLDLISWWHTKWIHLVWNGYIISLNIHKTLRIDFVGLVLWPRTAHFCLLGKAHSKLLPKVFSRDLQVYECIRTHKLI